jgi:anti-anti-sigma regulatory factor
VNVNTSPVHPPDFAIETVARETELWIDVRGDADFTNYRQLHAVLGRIELNGAQSVHFDLSGLTFCDVFAFRQLIKFGTQIQAQGRTVYVHGATSPIMQMAWFLKATDEIKFV